MEINENLKRYLKKSKKKTPLFVDCKSHAYLLKPSHLITKPIFAVMVLKQIITEKDLGPFAKVVRNKFDWHSGKDMKNLWRHKRQILKDDKEFIDSLFDFDVRSVTPLMADTLRRMYANDRWMEFDLIQRESNLSGYLYVWT